MWLDLLIPRFPVRQLPAMLAVALVGALAAGLYGIVHDQLTYTLSPEYFTRLKFQQFAWADLGLPRRVFVGQIGLLASWWVGLIGGWFLGRAGAAELPMVVRRLLVIRGFAIVAVVTLIAGVIGWLYGALAIDNSDLSDWQIARASLGVRDLRSFVVVASIHNATYLGAASGIVLAILYVRRAVVRGNCPANSGAGTIAKSFVASSLRSPGVFSWLPSPSPLPKPSVPARGSNRPSASSVDSGFPPKAARRSTRSIRPPRK
jgi:hypothetical protein